MRNVKVPDGFQYLQVSDLIIQDHKAFLDSLNFNGEKYTDEMRLVNNLDDAHAVKKRVVSIYLPRGT